jgi:hypothetical protein
MDFRRKILPLDTEKSELFLNARWIGDFQINHEYCGSVSVFYSENPDLSKGHKHVPYLFLKGDVLYVAAVTKEEFEPFRKRDAVQCLSCNDIVYSSDRHDMVYCSCGKQAIDGGFDYTKLTGDETGRVLGVVDFLDGTFTPYHP